MSRLLLKPEEKEAAALARARIEFGLPIPFKGESRREKEISEQDHKSNRKFEIVRGQELLVLVRVPLTMAEVWAEIGIVYDPAKRAFRPA